MLNRRVSTCREVGFVCIAELFQSADVAVTNLETLIHDYDGPEVYPAAEGGWSWMRSPAFVADELRWLGFDLLSLANNHALDYSYGGIKSTWDALDAKGLAHAGTGRDLGGARAPAYFDTGRARVALISMTSTYTKWSRAGASRVDMKGRPGVNPLGYHHLVDRPTLDSLVELGTKLGWWISRVSEREWLMNPAGLHNTLYRYVESAGPGVTTEVDESDAEENLRTIRDARKRADLVLVHIHNHEWDPADGLAAPPAFLPPFARRCIDAGADVFLAQGSHAPIRGIELYKGRPIFYDPGDLFTMSGLVTRFPSDFYERHALTLVGSPYTALPAEGLAARAARAYTEAVSPPRGYQGGRLRGGFVPVLDYDDDLTLRGIRLYPLTWGRNSATFAMSKPGEVAYAGIPMLAEGATGEVIVEYVRDLSRPFATQIEGIGGVGCVVLDP